MITFSEIARQKVLELMKAESRDGLALRFAIAGRGPGGFRYRLGFEGPGDRTPQDAVLDAGGFEVWVDPESAVSLAGTTVDFVETPTASGFKIENPNPLWADPLAAAVQKVLDEDINPAVGSHGGFVNLVDVKDGVAYLKFGGGCQGCGMVDVTLKQGVAVRIREVVPGIREVLDVTDHAGGSNPYYSDSKGGSSPAAR